MRKYLPKCPHLKEVKRERGDFEDFIQNGKKCSRYIVEKSWIDIVPCGNSTFDVIREGCFKDNGGIDILGKVVKCKACGKEYFLFPQPNFKEHQDG